VEAEKVLMDLIHSLLSSRKIDAIIFEDYDKGVITPGIISETIRMAGQKGIMVTADPKYRNFCHYRNLDLFTPNLKEMADGLRLDIPRGEIEEIKKAAFQLQEINNIRYLLVTLSEMGIYLSHGKSGKLVPTEIRDIADVSGAGDTVISVATACLTAGAGAGNTAMVANLAGGLVCGKVGVIPIGRQQLLEETLLLFKRKG
jgi:D-glycero-beta-D-manno-heptose-7-phosphate kinase